MDFVDKYLHWIIVAFAWIWMKIHDFVVFIGLGSGGAGWVVSIVILTLLVRAAIIPLYIKQIRSTRGMQAIQPQLQKLQAKYKGKTDAASRQRQSEEMMALYKKAGTSPYSSCLPMLVQMPVLFALYRVIFAVVALHSGTYLYPNLGPLDTEVATNIYNSDFLGVSLFDTLTTTPGALKLVFVFLILVMVTFQFLTMRMSMTKNMPAASDPNNPMVRSQKMMMYLMPAMFIFTGLVFMMALLIYMVITTVFSWAQQLWVIKVLPTPGSPAYKELVEKREKKYQAWAKPFFEQYQSASAELVKDSPELLELQEKTLVEVKSKAKRDHVDQNFPESWTAADQLGIYRNLAVEPWKTLPDKEWMKGIAAARVAQKNSSSRQARQPKKLTREQRARRAELERRSVEEQAKAEARAAKKEQRKASKPGANLTPEEIEKRRQARRAQQRKRGNPGKGSKGKN